MSRFRQLMIANQGSKYPANATVWEVTIPEGGANYQFFIRNRSSSSVVDWGDGSVETISATGDRSPAHTYPAGSYTVSLTGTYDLVHIGSGNATYGKLVTRLVQVSEELTDYSSLCKYCAITELPAGFTIPYGVTTVSGMFESCKIPYLPEGFSLPETVIRMDRMFYAGGLKEIPDSFYLNNNIQQASNVFWVIGGLSTDVAKFFGAITSDSELRNVSAMFGVTGVYGTVPLNSLTAITSLSATTNCFLNCTKLTNFTELPPSWGGGKVILENQTITTSATIDAVIAKINENYAAYAYQYDVKFTSANMPEGLTLNYNWSTNPSNCKLQGTLPAGTYTFDVTLSNKWSSATATITLIVK